MFEVMKVYFIMPFPGSQRMNSLDVAYFLHTYRWPLRGTFALLLLLGFANAFQAKRKWVPTLFLLLAAVVAYYFNFEMTADSISRNLLCLLFPRRAAMPSTIAAWW